MQRKHLFAAIAATAVATTACKKKPVAEDEPSTSSSASAKRLDWELSDLVEVNTTSPVQGVMVWAQELDYSGKEVKDDVMFEVGRRCLPGPHESECAQSWRSLVEKEHQVHARAWAIVTRDVDRHELITDEAQLRALLGPIDTPAEAAILASFLGASKVFVPQCDGFSRTIVMRMTDAGYAMTLEKRVRKGELKKPDGAGCANCIVAETRKKVVVSPKGVVDLGTAEESEWIKPSGCGRSPGWSSVRARRARTAGDYLAHAAHLEAASVAAFERIAVELEALGAPAALVLRARRAAREEVAHARILGGLAREQGKGPLPFFSRPYALRDAFALALDNAVEGCVNETYGALVLHVQALTAKDPATRAAFARIAEDEASHAELSTNLAEWLATQLSPTERAAVRAAGTEARAQIDLDPAIDDEEELRRLGLPDHATSRALHALFVEAWESRPVRDRASELRGSSNRV